MLGEYLHILLNNNVLFEDRRVFSFCIHQVVNPGNLSNFEGVFSQTTIRSSCFMNFVSIVSPDIPPYRSTVSITENSGQGTSNNYGKPPPGFTLQANSTPVRRIKSQQICHEGEGGFCTACMDRWWAGQTAAGCDNFPLKQIPTFCTYWHGTRAQRSGNI